MGRGAGLSGCTRLALGSCNEGDFEQADASTFILCMTCAAMPTQISWQGTLRPLHIHRHFQHPPLWVSEASPHRLVLPYCLNAQALYPSHTCGAHDCMTGHRAEFLPNTLPCHQPPEYTTLRSFMNNATPAWSNCARTCRVHSPISGASTTKPEGEKSLEKGMLRRLHLPWRSRDSSSSRNSLLKGPR